MTGSPLLVTSLPPRMRRLNSAGADVGPAYQNQCIESWLQAGLRPVSVNSSNEPYPHFLEKFSVTRDAAALTGRSLVFLEDMLEIASVEARDRPFVVTNSDVLFAPRADFLKQVEILQPGEMLFGRRTDIADIGDADGIAWRYGYDVFAVHPRDVSALRTKMVFGAPWWDHLFPLKMYLNKVRIIQISPGQFLHLVHEDRWDWDIWKMFGKCLLSELGNESEKGEYSRHLKTALGGYTGNFCADMKYSLWRRLPWNIARDVVPTLHRVSELNLSYLDQVSVSGLSG
jgi:hypothetical protein